MPEVTDHNGELDGLPVFWRSAEQPGGGGQAPALYLHGVPGNSDEWVLPPGFLERSGGLAPDLPGFGRSGKPAFLRYTIDEYDRFIERFLDELAWSACSWWCTTGARWGSRSRSACPSAWSAW